MLDWLFSVEALGAFLTCFATLMIFSFLYRDNPYYKFAEHVFVGVSTGYGIVLMWFQILRPNLLDRLAPPVDAVRQQLFRAGDLSPEAYANAPISLGQRLAHGQFVYYVFLALGVLMLFKISRKYHWLSRWPLAYVIGAFAGIQIIQAAQGALVPQLEATMKDFSGRQTLETWMADSCRALPAGELASRRREEAQWVAEWLVALGADPTQSQSAGQAWQTEQERELNAVAGLQDLKQPGLDLQAAFKDMRLGQSQVLEAERDFEALLCAALGGKPFDSFRPGSGLDSLALVSWQHNLILVATRVWLESPQGRASQGMAFASTLQLPPTVAAEALAYPAGRPSLTELFKAEAFPAAAQPDWSLPTTRHLADSLLSDVNARPARLADWKSSQVQDLLQRLGQAGGLDVKAELEARMQAFQSLAEPARGAARTAFLEFWHQGLSRELRDLRQSWLLHTIALHTSPDLLSSFTRDELKAFSQDPATWAALHGARDGRGAAPVVSKARVRTGMAVEIFSNLLVLVGVCAGIFYFFFSKKHTGALGVLSKVGIAFLMMSFGASFGYTVMGRISLAIGRFQDLLAWPWMAGTALVVLVVALALESRRKSA